MKFVLKILETREIVQETSAWWSILSLISIFTGVIGQKRDIFQQLMSKKELAVRLVFDLF